MASSAIQIREGQIEEPEMIACRIRCPFPEAWDAET